LVEFEMFNIITKLTRRRCWTSWEKECGTGLNIRWQKMMTALPNKEYYGQRKTATKEINLDSKMTTSS